MKKRHFLGAAFAAAALPNAPACAAAKGSGPVLLTVTGAIAHRNRGPFDPALDQMMGKHKLAFEHAFAFDWQALAALPHATIRPTLEYDAKAHTLRGPRLEAVLAAAGARLGKEGRIVLRAIDGYAVTLAGAQARHFIVATHLDGQPMALGGLGPLWALVDADRLPERAGKALAERFGDCPWGLYHVDVQA